MRLMVIVNQEAALDMEFKHDRTVHLTIHEDNDIQNLFENQSMLLNLLDTTDNKVVTRNLTKCIYNAFTIDKFLSIQIRFAPKSFRLMFLYFLENCPIPIIFDEIGLTANELSYLQLVNYHHEPKIKMEKGIITIDEYMNLAQNKELMIKMYGKKKLTGELKT